MPHYAHELLEENKALRAENERLLDYYEQQGCDAAIKENERLREALENIACLEPLTQGDVAVRRARAALQSKGE